MVFMCVISVSIDSCADLLINLSHPERTVTIAVPLPTVPAVPHPLWGVRVRSFVAFQCLSVALIAISMVQLNSSNAQGGPSCLVALVASKLPQ
jgi:hypothetical protein